MKRIGLCGIGSENCTFSPDRLSREDFAIYEGDELDERYGFVADNRYSTIETVNLKIARALPGGPIQRATYDELVGEILDSIRSRGPWDAIYLDLHGAMHVEGMRDAEDDFAGQVKSVVGSDCPIGASFDLHGNLTSSLARKLTSLSAYRTAPHEDEPETRARAFRQLVEHVENPVSLARCRIPIPVLLPGECTSTQYDPGKSLYRNVSLLEQQYDLRDLSLFVGYAWADEARSTACVIATGEVAEQCREAAIELASQYWSVRERFTFGMDALPSEEVLVQAENSRMRPVIISDSGDNPTAGGVGNLVVALRAVLDSSVASEVVVAGIWDSAATSACFDAGQGAELELKIGTTMPGEYGTPIELQVCVERLHEGDLQASRQAVVRASSRPNVQIVLTERRKPFHYLADFEQLGIEPDSLGILIVKIGYLVPELFGLAAQHWLALTPGAVDQDLERLKYQELIRPMFPMDREFNWLPESSFEAWQVT
ncbi:MAG: M81 family metallopeptidase [Planctomycetota bacterium]